MKKFLKSIANGLIWSMLIVISCRADTGRPDTKVYEPDDGAITGDGNFLIKEVQAAPIDAGMPSPIMPDDPAHISLRFPKESPKLMVAMLSKQPVPYKFDIFDTGDELVLTLYIPKDEEFPIIVSSADENGEPIGPSKTYFLRPNARLGSAKVDLKGAPGIISFHDDAVVELSEGNNAMIKDSTEEFIDGEVQIVRQGSYIAPFAQYCRLSWSGTSIMYMFGNDEPECMAEPFDYWFEEGEELSVYPVDQGNPEGIAVHIEILD